MTLENPGAGIGSGGDLALGVWRHGTLGGVAHVPRVWPQPVALDPPSRRSCPTCTFVTRALSMAGMDLRSQAALAVSGIA